MATAPGRRGGGTLGTFGGVFTPSVLTILGLVLFLRTGFVVGGGGLLLALGILALATSISVSTSLSLAAIATNRKVRAGGDYYLISRSLGISAGGALGLLLFAAQAFSAAFYCIGFGEGVAALTGSASPVLVPGAAAGAALLLIALAFVGADFATRFQFGIMAILALALVSFFVGGLGRFDADLVAQNWRAPADTLGFWPLFAIFFPAVTGFTQGVSMSGELRDARHSLPLGTFLAVGVSTVVYLAAMLVLAGALPAATLASDTSAMRTIAARSGWVDAGILSATLSSGLASLLGAPRILQALARDGVFWQLRFFAHGHGESQNPRRAVLLTGAIALVTIAAGDLDTIAALVSMFFLISYGLLNYATYVEARGASPSFRPRFRFFHARASGVGVLLCGGAMLAIDPIAGGVALALLAAVYQYVRRTAVPAQWRDSRWAYRFRQVREGLRDLAVRGLEAGEWLPQMLVFTDDPERRARVLRFASWISGGAGLVTAVRIIASEGAEASTQARCEAAERALREEIEALGIDAHALAMSAPDARQGSAAVLQSWGAGPIRSNLVVVNWLGPHPEGDEATLWYGYTLGEALRLHRSVVVLDADTEDWQRLEETPNERRRIDVWWFGGESSRLMLLLAYLVTRSESWDEAQLRVLIATTAGHEEQAAASAKRRLEEMRIDADVESVASPDAKAVAARSGDAALVFMPLRLPAMRPADPFGIGLDVLLPELPIVALGAAAEDVVETAQDALRRFGAGGAEGQPEPLLQRMRELSREAQSPLEYLTHQLHPWVAFVVMPVFALANAGVTLDASTLGEPATSRVAVAVALGLLIGKPIGVTLFSFVAVKLGIATLPGRVSLGSVFGAGLLAGIGFTMALFITALAFGEGANASAAKVGVLSASAVACVLGVAVLWWVLPRAPSEADEEPETE